MRVTEPSQSYSSNSNGIVSPPYLQHSLSYRSHFSGKTADLEKFKPIPILIQKLKKGDDEDRNAAVGLLEQLAIPCMSRLSSSSIPLLTVLTNDTKAAALRSDGIIRLLASENKKKDAAKIVITLAAADGAPALYSFIMLLLTVN